MRMVSETLEVSRSNIQEQFIKKPQTKEPKSFNDKWLLPLIKEITDSRPTYGYRRMTAVLNLKLQAMNKDVVNHKRIYRIMKKNDLLLARYGRKKT